MTRTVSGTESFQTSPVFGEQFWLSHRPVPFKVHCAVKDAASAVIHTSSRAFLKPALQRVVGPDLVSDGEVQSVVLAFRQVPDDHPNLIKYNLFTLMTYRRNYGSGYLESLLEVRHAVQLAVLYV